MKTLPHDENSTLRWKLYLTMKTLPHDKNSTLRWKLYLAVKHYFFFSQRQGVDTQTTSQWSLLLLPRDEIWLFIVVIVVVCLFVCLFVLFSVPTIEDPPVENPKLKGSPFKAWSRSVHSPACYAYCRRLLLSSFLSFRSIHLHFFPPKPLPSFPVLAVVNTGSCVGPQNKIGHPARRSRQLIPVLGFRGI